MAIILCIAILPIARCKTKTQQVLIVLLLLVHIGVSIYYYIYTNNAFADARGYYYDPQNEYIEPFTVGTVATFKIVHFLKSSIHASYFDCFLIFQSVGFAGLLILARVFKEIEEKIGVEDRNGYLLLLFLPTVLFWTSAIGKDAPLFFAISVAVWSMLRLRHRFLFFCFAVGVMVLFRAHIALITMSAVAAAAFFEGRSSLGRRVGLMMVALIGVWLVIGPAQRTINFDQKSVSSITTYIEQQQSIYATAGGTTAVIHAPFIVRIVSLLFRPFFFDARGILGFVPSVENVGTVLVVIYTLAHWRNLAHLARRVFFIRFTLMFSALLLFSLALVYYNVGLGLRERVMAYPMIFSTLVALWSFRRKAAVASSRDLRSGGLLPAGVIGPVSKL